MLVRIVRSLHFHTTNIPYSEARHCKLVNYLLLEQGGGGGGGGSYARRRVILPRTCADIGST